MAIYDTKVKFVCDKHFKPEDFSKNHAGWTDHEVDDKVS